ncbi:hypothetical protein HFP72_27385 [Nocardiopsis sp. ARC36]
MVVSARTFAYGVSRCSSMVRVSSRDSPEVRLSFVEEDSDPAGEANSGRWPGCWSGPWSSWG